MLVFALKCRIFFFAEHGYLRGKRKLPNVLASAANDETDDKLSNRRTLMDLIIETINKCSEDFDEGVQVQVRQKHSIKIWKKII